MTDSHPDPTLEAAAALEREQKRCHVCKSKHILTNGALICGQGRAAGQVMAAPRFGCIHFKAAE